MIISANNITKFFGDVKVLDNVSFQINNNEKYAICGSNGVGKSTLLKILVDELSIDEGEVVKAKDLKIGYLAQYIEDDSNDCILDSVINARADLIDMEHRLSLLEEDMTGDAINEHDKLLREFQDKGGLYYKSMAESVLKGLGFDEDEFYFMANMI